MSKRNEQMLFQYLAQHNNGVLGHTDLFSQFANTDAVLAAYIDGNLSAAQQQAVKHALAGSQSLRQQWQQTMAAQQANAALHAAAPPSQAEPTRRPRMALAAMAACMVMVSVVVLNMQPSSTVNELAQQGSILLEPGQDIGVPLASQAIAVHDWQLYLAVYEGVTQEIGEPGSPATELALLASAIKTMELINCSANKLELVQTRFYHLAQQYPQEFLALQPADHQQWCQLGKTLQHYVKHTVLMNKSKN